VIVITAATKTKAEFFPDNVSAAQKKKPEAAAESKNCSEAAEFAPLPLDPGRMWHTG
jgi:hypothetical protein